MYYIDQIRQFVKTTLPAREGIPYLVKTPACASPSRCKRMARIRGDKTHVGIKLEESTQSQVTEWFYIHSLDQAEKIKLYQQYIELISQEDVPDLDYVLEHIPNPVGRVFKTPHLLLRFFKGTHRYSFYL